MKRSYCACGALAKFFNATNPVKYRNPWLRCGGRRLGGAGVIITIIILLQAIIAEADKIMV